MRGTALPRIACLALACLVLSSVGPVWGKNPEVEETKEGDKILVLPSEVEKFLSQEFPGYRIPKTSDFNPAMLEYFYSRLIGVHPAVAYGDFNGDKKRDYALILITGDTKWGPLVELIVLNGTRRSGEFDVFHLGELYAFKDDYLSFNDGKLYKGRLQKGGWYISWDPKKQTYNVVKS